MDAGLPPVGRQSGEQVGHGHARQGVARAGEDPLRVGVRVDDATVGVDHEPTVDHVVEDDEHG